jgi:probable HAF family extracellular repeat protein
MIDLGGLPGYTGYSDGWDINNKGQVIGNCRTSLMGSIRGFLWDPIHGMQDLGTIFPRAINNNGTIVGGSGTAMMKPAGGSWINLGFAANSYAEGINDNDVVVGTVDSPYRVVYRWDSVNGSDILEEDLPGGKYLSAAIAIDISGRILCNGYKTGDIYHAYIWDNGVVTDLGNLPGDYDYSQAGGMNDLGQVVGNSSGSAFIWQSDTGMVNLNDLLDETGIGWHLAEAFGINKNGMIVGQGELYQHSSIHAFLLTPIPEPNMLFLLIDGPNSVPEKSDTQYQVIGHYDNGSSKNITVDANLIVAPDEFAQIDSNGLLATDRLYRLKELCTIKADCKGFSASKPIAIYPLCDGNECTPMQLAKRDIADVIKIKQDVMDDLKYAMKIEWVSSQLLAQIDSDKKCKGFNHGQLTKARIQVLAALIWEQWANKKIYESVDSLEDALKILQENPVEKPKPHR